MDLKKNNALKIELTNNILLFTTLKKSIEEDEWKDCQLLVNEYYKFAETQNQEYGVIINMSSISFLKPKFYINWKEKYLENKNNSEKYVFAACVIIHNFFIRHFVNMFFTVYKLNKPFKLVKNLKEGYEFINKYKSPELI